MIKGCRRGPLNNGDIGDTGRLSNLFLFNRNKVVFCVSLFLKLGQERIFQEDVFFGSAIVWEAVAQLYIYANECVFISISGGYYEASWKGREDKPYNNI